MSADGPTLKLRLAGDGAALESARVAVLDYLAPFAPSAKAAYAIELVLEEVLTNQFKYAVAGRAEATVALTLKVERGEAQLHFEDDGAAFDPLHAATPQSPRSLDEAKVGGLGLVLVRRFATHAAYERRDGCNRLTIGVALG